MTHSSKLGDKYANNIFVGDIGVLTDGYLYYFEVNEDRTGLKFDNNSSQARLTDLIADNEEEMSAIAIGTTFGGITDIETGPHGFFVYFDIRYTINRFFGITIVDGQHTILIPKSLEEMLE